MPGDFQSTELECCGKKLFDSLVRAISMFVVCKINSSGRLAADIFVE